MAEDIENVPASVRRESICGIGFQTDAAKSPADWNVEWFFERGLYDAVTGELREPTVPGRVVRRRFGDIAAQSFDGETGARIAALLKLAGYQFRAADIAAEQSAGEGNADSD